MCRAPESDDDFEVIVDSDGDLDIAPPAVHASPAANGAAISKIKFHSQKRQDEQTRSLSVPSQRASRTALRKLLHK